MFLYTRVGLQCYGVPSCWDVVGTEPFSLHASKEVCWFRQLLVDLVEGRLVYVHVHLGLVPRALVVVVLYSLTPVFCEAERVGRC